MAISNYKDFLREMLTRANPQSVKRRAFERACDMMWHDGCLTRTHIANHTGVSTGTASRWVAIARTLGMEDGVRRLPDVNDPTVMHHPEPEVTQAESDSEHGRMLHRMSKARAHRRTTSAPAESARIDPGSGPTPPPDKLREEAIERAYNDMYYSEVPEIRFKAIETLTKIVPGFKAPETRLDVQILIGKGAEDRLNSDLRDNLKFLMREDPDWLQSLMTDIGVPIALPEVTDAETEDVDDADDLHRTLPPSQD